MVSETYRRRTNKEEVIFYQETTSGGEEIILLFTFDNFLTLYQLFYIVYDDICLMVRKINYFIIYLFL